MARDLVVRFKGDSTGFDKTAEGVERKTRQIGDTAQKAGGKAKGGWDGIGDSAEKAGKKSRSGLDVMSGAVGGVAKVLAPIALAMGALGAVDWVGGSIDAARESEKVGKTTTAIIKATGGAAKVTADQVGDLAAEISKKTGLDDEAIQSSSNLLLTFKNVRNELGKGNAVFDRATMAAQDLAAAGFGDAAGQAKMLGKALNDPVKGISALSRSGVTFSASQEKQIKQMVKQGDLLGAQKVILGEVEKQVGGTAEAQASAADKAEVAWGNLQEELGEKLLPVADKLATFTTEKLIPALSDLFTWLEKNVGPAVETVAGGLEDMAGWVEDVLSGKEKPQWMTDLADWFADVKKDAEPVAAAWRDVVDAFEQKPGEDGFLEWYNNDLKPAVDGLAQTFEDAEAKIRPILNDISTKIAGFLVEHEPEIRQASETIGSIVTGLVELIDGVVSAWATSAAQFWRDWGWAIETVVGGVFEWILVTVQGALDILDGIIKVATGVITGDWDKAWEGLQQIVDGAVNTVIGWVEVGWGTLTKLFSEGFARAQQLARDWGLVDAMDKTFRWIRDVWKGAQDLVERPIRAAKDGIKTAMDLIGDQFGRLQELAAKPVRFVINTVFNDGIRGAFNSLAETFGADARIPRLSAGFAAGGWTGPGNEFDPAGEVHADEFVVRKRARSRFEAKFPGYLSYINENGTLPGYAGGGWVKPINANSSGWNGGRYSSGKWHGGLDFPAPTGTPVVSPGLGVVASKQQLATSYGHHYQLAMANGYRVILAHLSRLNVLPTVGMPVVPGMELGLSGSTGNSTGPHLHFEVIPPGGSHGSAVDPTGMIGGYARMPGLGDVAKLITDKFAPALDQLGGLGDSPMARVVGAVPKRVVSMAGDALKRGLQLRDSGGPLPPGTSLVQNNTGRDEHVLTGEQMDRLLDLLERVTRQRLEIRAGDDLAGLLDVATSAAPPRREAGVPA